MTPLGAYQKITNRFLDELVTHGKLSSDLPGAIKAKYRSNAEVAEFLLHKLNISEEDVAKAASVAFNLPFVHLSGRSIPREILNIIPAQTARKFLVVPFEKTTDNIVKVAVARPYNLNPQSVSSSQGVLGEIEKLRQVKIQLHATTIPDIIWALNGYNQTAGVQSQPQIVQSAPPQPAQPVLPPATTSVRSISLVGMVIAKNILNKFPKEVAQKYSMIVFDMPSENIIKVAVVSPDNPRVKDILDFIEKKNDIKIELYQTDLAGINWAMQGYLSSQSTVGVKSVDSQVEKTDSSSPKQPKSESEAGLPAISKVDEMIKNLPGGISPDLGGATDEGIVVIGAKEIMAMQASNITVGLQGAGTGTSAGDNLEERNLDNFLGKEITNTEELIEIVKSGFVPKMVAGILSYGIFLKASDIHLEPLKHFFRLRYRVDGQLSEFLYIPLTLHPPITSRIKIFSNLKIDEQRIPQDGRYDAVAAKHEFDVRVSTLPTVYGEKIVMRLLDKSAGAFSLEQMGLDGKPLERLLTELKKPWGIVLATGPTGSGKSTSLYAILNRITNPSVNVITLEDPVEYEIKGVNQVQVKPKIGFSFAEGLRSVLRQDPNIIMVGEIRDGETAALATHAALTGHLVLSTLHTNNAAGALPRLINMQVEPFLITSAINAIIAQRLVRKLCQECKQEATVPEKIIEQVKDIVSNLHDGESAVNLENMKFFKPEGCPKCKNGYSGRIGLYEILIMSDKIEDAVINKKSASEIEEIAIAEGMVTLQQDGIIKALKGLTSLDEVFKVTTSD